MTKEQKVKADELERQIKTTRQDLADLQEIMDKASSNPIAIRMDYVGGVRVPSELKKIVLTLVDTNLKERLSSLESEFAAL